MGRGQVRSFQADNGRDPNAETLALEKRKSEK
jgi:hypothetical protein